MPSTATLQMTNNDQRTAAPSSPTSLKADKKIAPTGNSNPLAGMGAAWLLIGSVVIGVVIGLGIDRHFKTMPWATLGCSLFFMAAGIYLVIREGSR